MGHLTNGRQNWIGIGRALGRDLPRSDVRIAVGPAGAIPFYSRLPAIDMLGLNDRWVARYGDPFLPIPGHRRRAPLSYLIDRDVNLVIGHPWVVMNRERPDAYPAVFLEWIEARNRTGVPVLAPLRVVEMPLDRDSVASMVYLTPHSDIDRLITIGKWRAVAIVQE
jgi:hypothetical protein